MKYLPLGIIIAVIIALGADLAFTCTPEPAAAQQVAIDPDTAYLTFLAAKNVGITSPAAGIEMGHRVCAALTAEHVNRWMEGTRLVSIGYTGDEAATIVGASVAAYCQNQAASYDNQR